MVFWDYLGKRADSRKADIRGHKCSNARISNIECSFPIIELPSLLML